MRNYLLMFLVIPILLFGQKSPHLQYTKQNSDSSALIEKQQFVLPISYDGIIADLVIDGNYYSGKFDDISCLFSAGFYLSGYVNGELWGNGLFTTSRINDYLPGKVNGDSLDTRIKIYSLSDALPDFDQTWLNWKSAVELGAKFYDGDNDGIYNPIDKNQNGFWDYDEDRPDLIGQETYWYVINDGVPIENRRYLTNPLGIEIRTTFFISRNSETDPFENTVFIRYELENMGTVSEKLENVLFSFALDPDIGDYYNDLAGSDPISKSGFVYGKENDSEYGLNSPTVLMSLLEGPAQYSKGISYEDLNGNDSYDAGIDIALDTAIIRSGINIGETILPGAHNSGLQSVMNYMSSHPSNGDPNNQLHLRNYQLGGKYELGDSIFISTWQFGNGSEIGLDSNLYPSKYIYWGDPEEESGWLNIFDTDQRLMVTTGPFDLEVGNPKIVLGALILARGITGVNSVTLAKEHALAIAQSYQNNFNELVSAVKEINQDIPQNFELSQNYPNPFNPTTSIEYSVPSNEYVSLKIFDVLGRETTTLVNEQKSAGNYKVTFDASNLTSGVYFYRLQTSSGFVSTKKLMLIK